MDHDPKIGSMILHKRDSGSLDTYWQVLVYAYTSFIILGEFLDEDEAKEFHDRLDQLIEDGYSLRDSLE